MSHIIRPMTDADRKAVLGMMQEFYSSPAVFTNGSLEIFQADIDACLGENPYIQGFILEHNQEIAGYAMVAKSFSAEFGKPCIWIEDLYMKEAYRNMGLGSQFLSYVEKRYPEAVFRLEVEEDNLPAVHVYTKQGYQVLPYTEMKK